MAESVVRPAFVPLPSRPFVDVVDVAFEWWPGHELHQKQRSVRSLHAAAKAKGLERPLEVSSRSELALGVALSAFNLRLPVSAGSGSAPVESVYQASKLFERGGPYVDIVGASPRDAKRDRRLRNSGPLVGFVWSSRVCPLEPKTAFYDWVYLRALQSNPDLARQLDRFGFFTDIEFDPGRMVSCQARTTAMYVGMVRAGIAPETIESFEALVQTVTGKLPIVRPWTGPGLDF